MPSLVLEIATLLVTGLFTGGAVYGAIRADLRYMRERIAANEHTASRAHERIDDFLRGKR